MFMLKKTFCFIFLLHFSFFNFPIFMKKNEFRWFSLKKVEKGKFSFFEKMKMLSQIYIFSNFFIFSLKKFLPPLIFRFSPKSQIKTLVSATQLVPMDFVRGSQ